MDATRNELKERLLAQQVPDPERLANYRKGVEAMLEQLQRERWWVGLAQAILLVLGIVVLFFGTFVFGMVSLYLAAEQNASLVQVWLPALLGLLCLGGAIALLRHFSRRARTRDLLLEIKRLELRVLELEESQRTRGER